MLNQIKSPRFIVLILLILAAAATRALPLLIPHIWGFTAIYALAIFAGAQFNNKALAVVIPLAAMAISDLFIGDGFIMTVYIGFTAIVLCGMAIQKHLTVTTIGLASIVGAVLFFLITNFAFFYPETYYPHNIEGVITSYVRGLPFLRNALISDLIYVPLLFGSFYFLSKRYPSLATD
jgi:hypothetical protein